MVGTCHTEHMSDTTTIYTATSAERAFAAAWHGGQASMLYAVCSTGALQRGTSRPWHSATVLEAAQPFTDEEWNEYLIEALVTELAQCNPESNDGYYDDEAERADDLATRDGWIRALQQLQS